MKKHHFLLLHGPKNVKTLKDFSKIIIHIPYKMNLIVKYILARKNEEAIPL